MARSKNIAVVEEINTIPKTSEQLPIVITKQISLKCYCTSYDNESINKILSITQEVRQQVGHITKAFMVIGYNLWRVKHENLFYACTDGEKVLSNVYEFCELAFDMKRTSCKNLIGVVERFSVRDSLDNPTFELKPEYENFSYTQLAYMLPLTDEQLQNVSPDMTVREIASIRKPALPEKEEDKTTALPYSVNRPNIFTGYLTNDMYSRIQDRLCELIDKGVKVQIMVVQDDTPDQPPEKQ